MALMGAEVLFYPTAIGSEPYDADLDTSPVSYTHLDVYKRQRQCHRGGDRRAAAA